MRTLAQNQPRDLTSSNDLQLRPAALESTRHAGYGLPLENAIRRRVVQRSPQAPGGASEGASIGAAPSLSGHAFGQISIHPAQDQVLLQSDDSNKEGPDLSGSQTRPLRLVFYQQDDKDDRDSFKAHASLLAASLGAIRIPDHGCPADLGEVGGNYCNRPENVLVRAANYAECFQQKVDQVHVVGHVYSPGDVACLSGALETDQAQQYSPAAKIVVHGCKGVSRFGQQAARILEELPDATVYVHKASAESGGPLDFYKVTADPTSADPQTITERIPNVTEEGIGFSPEVISKWAAEQVQSLKQAVKANNQNRLDIIEEWLVLPIFESAELAVLAKAILDSSAGEIPGEIRRAAEKSLEKWKAGQEVHRDR